LTKLAPVVAKDAVTNDRKSIADRCPSWHESTMKDEMQEFSERMAQRADQVDMALAKLLDARLRGDEIARPDTLLAAMRHGVLNGGKRLRPFLLLETAELLGGDQEAALRVAAATECLHCYSLIHDDLPAMDDDSLRRGLPTVHVAFDEATAILAGDALLTMAFEIIAAPQTELAAGLKSELVLALAQASGLGGMAGGQALDLQAEKYPPDEAGIITLQSMKTGALIRFACEAGAILSGSNPTDRECMKRFGEAVGLAFQLADDLLDVTSDSQSMGKATGKDTGRGKGTLVALHGADWARTQLSGLVSEASSLLSSYGERARILLDAAQFVANRKH